MSSNANDDGYEGPRASVTELGGTISASVDETNRIRALLGLKPLREGHSEEKGKSIHVSTVEPAKPSAFEIRRRIDESRVKRTRAELISGPSLGERLSMTNSEDLDSTVWAARMRNKKPQKVANSIDRKAAIKENEEKSEEENDAIGGLLPDLKVIHKIHEFELKAGDEMILTLKDQRLIDEGGELDETEDLLENPELVAKSKRERSKSEKSRRTLYNPFQEELEDVVEIQAGMRKNKEVLRHYDEWAVEAKMVRKPKGADAAGATRLDDITANRGVERIPTELTLTSFVGVQKDFMTPDEVEAARKKAVANMKKGKKIKELGVPTKGIGTADDKEEVNVGNFYQRINPEIKRPPKPIDEPEEGPEDLDDAELYRQLVKRKNFSNHQRPQIKEDRSVADAVSRVKTLDELKVKLEAADADITSGVQSVGLVDIKPEDLGIISSSKGLEFTSTTEFCRVLETPLEKLQNTRQETTENPRFKRGLVAAPTTTVNQWRDDDADIPVDGIESVSLKPGDGGNGSESDEELTEQEEKAIEFLVSESLLDGGISSALNMLKSRGELSDDSWRLGRHSGENKPLHQSTGARDIKIEYKDEFGRVLGPKDAFRYISWAFHGKGPGKKKREKLLRKIETEKKKKAIAQNINILPTMQALRKQQKSGQAHVVLSAGSSSGSSRT